MIWGGREAKPGLAVVSMLSVIIPTHESERVLVRTLASLVPGATAGLVRDVILADARSQDETAAIADIAGCTLMVRPGPLAERLSAAAEAARAEWLLFLQPGTVLDPAWIGETTRFIEKMAVSGALQAATFRRAAVPGTGTSVIAELLAVLRRARTRPGPEQGLIVARRLYRELGGHRSAAPDPQTDLFRRLGRRRLVTLAAAAISEDI
jgi:glycosyltransferase involved in cell wall biosynthesis